MAGPGHDIKAIEHEAERVARELQIPPCPEILLRFVEEMRAPEPDLRRLAALIGADVSLSATMLATVNSPFFGLKTKAGNVLQALAILGLRGSANLVSCLLLRHVFPAASSASMKRFWERSMQLASLAAPLAALLKNVEREPAHTYALFRDCGMAVMLRRFPEYAEMMERADEIPGAELTLRERNRFGYHHARVGHALARSWFLPDPLCGAILCHHEFSFAGESGDDSADPRLVAFGLLAEQIAALHAHRGLCPDWPSGEGFVLDTLDVDPDTIVRLAEELRHGER